MRLSSNTLAPTLLELAPRLQRDLRQPEAQRRLLAVLLRRPALLQPRELQPARQRQRQGQLKPELLWLPLLLRARLLQ